MCSKDFRVLVLEVWRDTEDIGVESCEDIYSFKFNGLNEVMISLGQSSDAAHAYSVSDTATPAAAGLSLELRPLGLRVVSA